MQKKVRSLLPKTLTLQTGKPFRSKDWTATLTGVPPVNFMGVREGSFALGLQKVVWGYQ